MSVSVFRFFWLFFIFYFGLEANHACGIWKIMVDKYSSYTNHFENKLLEYCFLC